MDTMRVTYCNLSHREGLGPYHKIRWNVVLLPPVVSHAPTSMIDTAVDPPYIAPTIDSAYDAQTRCRARGPVRIQTETYGFAVEVNCPLVHEPDFDFLDGFSDRFLAQNSLLSEQ